MHQVRHGPVPGPAARSARRCAGRGPRRAPAAAPRRAGRTRGTAVGTDRVRSWDTSPGANVGDLGGRPVPRRLEAVVLSDTAENTTKKPEHCLPGTAIRSNGLSAESATIGPRLASVAPVR